MLDWLLEQASCSDIKIFETTVSPSNISSELLFKKFADKKDAIIDKSSFLGNIHMGVIEHEEEVLVKIKI